MLRGGILELEGELGGREADVEGQEDGAEAGEGVDGDDVVDAGAGEQGDELAAAHAGRLEARGPGGGGAGAGGGGGGAFRGRAAAALDAGRDADLDAGCCRGVDDLARGAQAAEALGLEDEDMRGARVQETPRCFGAGQVLAGGDGRCHRVLHAPQTFEVARRYRLLNVLDVEGLQRPYRLDGLVDAPGAVGVEAQLHVRAEGLADGGDAAAFLIEAGSRPDLELHGLATRGPGPGGAAGAGLSGLGGVRGALTATGAGELELRKRATLPPRWRARRSQAA